MKKRFLLSIMCITLLATFSPKVINAIKNNSIASSSNTLIDKKNNQKEKNNKINEFNKKLPSNSKETIEKFASEIPTLANIDINKIKNINYDLRIKYMNQTMLYDSISDLEDIDKKFVTQSSQDIRLYANLTPKNFGIDLDYYERNSEECFESMIENTTMGIDHGYFLGDMKKEGFDPNGKERIRIILDIPKGTKLLKVGPLSESQYMLPRGTVFKYNYKTFDKSKGEIEIFAEIGDKKELEDETKVQENDINTEMTNRYGTPPDFIHLLPLGLNAGSTLTSSKEVVYTALELLNRGNILTKDLFNKAKIHLTNGGYQNTKVFDESVKGLSLAEKQRKFNLEYHASATGTTNSHPDLTSDIVIGYGLTYHAWSIPGMDIPDYFSSTILHESFHYLTNTTEHFKNRPLFKKKDSFMNAMQDLKYEEEDLLVRILGDDYARQNWKEFSSEAFMAKFHPHLGTTELFADFLPKTNRMFDNLFDYDPPTVPDNLKATEVSGASVKLTFDHSEDNVAVDKYNIYQDGKLIKSITTQKDKNGLSYPKPGLHQNKIEITIDKLEQFTNYEFQITAVDEALQESAKSPILKVKTKDTQPPALVGTLSGSALASTAAQLNWSHPTDNDKVEEVKVKKRCTISRKLFGSDTNALAYEDQEYIVPATQNYYIDSTIEKGKVYTYSMTAIDASGNESKVSNTITIKTEDKDDDKQNEDRAEDVNFSEATLNWDGAFPGLSPAGFNIFGIFFNGVSWVFGGMTSVSGAVTSLQVDLTSNSPHQFLVIPVDSDGNPLADGLKISVSPIDRSSIKAKDSTLYVSQKWNKEENFVNATDENGKAIPYNDKRITTSVSNVDTSKPGVHEIKYSYKGILKTIDATFKVTIKENKASITTRRSSIYVGQEWNMEENFVSATDEEGRSIPFSDSRILADKPTSLDMNKPGSYPMSYSYKGLGRIITSSFVLTIKADQSSITTTDSRIAIGQNWDFKNNFVYASDEDGVPVSYDDPRITVNATSMNTSKPGEYTVISSFKGKYKTSNSTFKVKVVENLIENGDFSNGFDKWKVYRSDISRDQIDILENEHGKYVNMVTGSYGTVSYGSINIDPNSVYEISYFGKGEHVQTYGNAILQISKVKMDGGVDIEHVKAKGDSIWRKYSTIINSGTTKYNNISLTFNGTYRQQLQFTNVVVKRIG